MVQDWIILEITLRLRATQYRPGTTLPPSLKHWLKFGQCTLSIVTISLFTAFSIATIITAQKDVNEGYAFSQIYDLLYSIIGCMFLA